MALPFPSLLWLVGSLTPVHRKKTLEPYQNRLHYCDCCSQGAGVRANASVIFQVYSVQHNIFTLLQKHYAPILKRHWRKSVAEKMTIYTKTSYSIRTYRLLRPLSNTAWQKHQRLSAAVFSGMIMVVSFRGCVAIQQKLLARQNSKEIRARRVRLQVSRGRQNKRPHEDLENVSTPTSCVMRGKLTPIYNALVKIVISVSNSHPFLLPTIPFRSAAGRAFCWNALRSEQWSSAPTSPYKAPGNTKFPHLPLSSLPFKIAPLGELCFQTRGLYVSPLPSSPDLVCFLTPHD